MVLPTNIPGHNTVGNKRRHRSLPPACLQSQTQVNLTGMPAVETHLALVASHFCSYIRTVFQAVPAAMSPVARQHMGTRL